MNRHEATRRVMMSLANPSQSARLRYVAPDGSRPLVVATPNEYISEVMKRVDAVGGSANLVLAEMKRFQVMVIESVPSASEDEADTENVNADISVGMFWIRAKARNRKESFFGIAHVSSEADQIQAFDYA